MNWKTACGAAKGSLEFSRYRDSPKIRAALQEQVPTLRGVLVGASPPRREPMRALSAASLLSPWGMKPLDLATLGAMALRHLVPPSTKRETAPTMVQKSAGQVAA
jgi:hypothetical protein